MAISKLKFLVLAALMAISFTETPQTAPNIEYLSMGYNIYKGDPLANDVDPGFTIRPIFNFTYSQNEVSPDMKYLEPDTVTIVGQSSCNLKSASDAISGANSYLKSLDVFVSVDAGCPFGGFSASTNYQTVSQTTTEQSTFYTLSTGQCSVYVADLSLVELPQFDSLFMKDIITALETSDSDAHYAFFDTYGTHFVEGITMGSRLSVMDSLTQTAWQSLESQGISVTTAAQASFLGFYAGYSTSVTTQNTQISSYNSASSNFQEITIGSVPPDNANSTEWAQQAVINPMPVKYSLSPLSKLFANEDFTSAIQAAGSQSPSTIQANVQAALNGGYCNYLLSNNIVATCSAIGADQSLPQYTASCVLCASSCGGTYSQAQGIFDITHEQPSWFMDYDSGCASTTYLNDPTYDHGVDLCCMSDESDAIVGSCRMCASCGGTYPNLQGGILNPNTDGWMNSYGFDCAGNLQVIEVSNQTYSLCCEEAQECAMCTECGGDYPFENGAIGVTDTSQRAFLQFGDSCSGSLLGGDAGMTGMKLCCSNK